MPEAGTIEIGFLVTNADKAKQSIVGVGTEFTKLGATSNTASTNLKKVDTTLGTTSTKTNTLKTSAGQLNTTLGQTNPKLTQTAAEMNKMGTSAGTTSPKITKLTTDQQKLATTSAQTTTNQRNLGLGMATAATSMVNLATQVTQLGNTYDSLNDAQLAIEKGADGVKKANDRVYSTTKAYNEALEDEKQTTEDVIVKKNAMENAIETLKNKQAAQNDLIEDTNRAWKQFALQIAGTVMTSLTGVMGSITALNSAKGLKGAATGIDGVAKSSHGLKAALGPIILVIAALAAAFFAIKNNTFGFRDALSDLGVKIGTAVPALKPVLEFLKQLGGFLGIAGDESATLKEKFITSITALKDQAIALFNQVVAAVQSFISQVLQIFDLLAQGDLAGAFKLIVDGIMGAWNTLNANEMVKGFIDKLIAFVTNPSSWTQLGTDIVNGILAAIVWTTDVLVPMLTTFVTSIVGFVTDINNWTPLWDALVTAWTDMQDWGKAIEDFITPFIDEIVSWFEDEKNWEELWKALTEAWVAMQDWGKAIVDFLKPFVDETVKYFGDEKNWALLWAALQKGWEAAFKWTAETIAPIVTNFFTALKDNFIPTKEETDAMAYNIVNGISTSIQEVAGAVGKILYETIFGSKGTASPEAEAVVTTGAQATTQKTLDEMIKEAEASTGKIKIAKMQKAIMDYFSETWKTNVEGYPLIAGYIWDGLLLEINKAVQARGSEINDVAQMVISFLATGFQSLVAQLQAIGNAIITYLITGLTQRYEQVKAEGKVIIDNIKAGIVDFAVDLMQTAVVIVNSIKSGLLAKLADIQKFGLDILGWIAEGIKNSATNLFQAPLVAQLTAAIEGVKKEFADFFKDPIGYLMGKFGGGGGGGENKAPEVKQGGDATHQKSSFDGGVGAKITNAVAGGTGGAAGGGELPADAGIFSELVIMAALAMQAVDQLQLTVTTFTVSVTGQITALGILFATYVTEIVQALFYEVQTLLLIQLMEQWTIFNEQFTTIIVGLGVLIATYITTIIQALFYEVQTLLLIQLLEQWTVFNEQFTTIIVGLGVLVATYISEIIQALFYDVQSLMLIQIMEQWSTFSIELTGIIVALGILVATFVNDIMIKLFQDLVVAAILKVQEAFSTLSTSVATYMKSMTTNTQTFVDALIKGFADSEASTKTFHTALSNLSTSWATYSKSMITHVESLRDAWLDMAEQVIQAIQDMVSELEDLVSGLEDVESAAKAATKALNAMAAAAAKAKSAASGVGARYGGIVSGATPRHAAKGAFINKKQRSVNGTQISEFGKWELVVPLSDPANAQDKNSLANAITAANTPATSPVNLGNMGFVNKGRGGGAGGGRPVIVQSNITTNLVVDGKKLASVVNPHIMTGQDAEL